MNRLDISWVINELNNATIQPFTIGITMAKITGNQPKDKNVFNIAVNGNFDDCQNLVKLMFADKIFSNEIKMSGVNSINWARIVAQSVYYFYSYFLIEDDNRPINFSVPTGNFGDVYAGYLAKKMGLPINKLILR